MSLINDALKRASARPVAAPPPDGPPLQPVESTDQSNSLPIVLGIVGIGALLMAGAFWLKSKGSAGSSGEQIAKQQPTIVATTQVASAAPVESRPVLQNPIERANATLQKVIERNSEQTTPAAAPVPASTEPAPIITATTAPITALVSTPAVTPSAVTTPAVTTPAIVPEPITPQPIAAPPPRFHLQAIYYRMHGPTVIINGRTLKVGDEVNGAKLIDIERTSAEIEYQGARQKLTMH
jgi:hypothetical protein